LFARVVPSGVSFFGPFPFLLNRASSLGRLPFSLSVFVSVVFLPNRRSVLPLPRWQGREGGEGGIHSLTPTPLFFLSVFPLPVCLVCSSGVGRIEGAGGLRTRRRNREGVCPAGGLTETMQIERQKKERKKERDRE